MIPVLFIPCSYKEDTEKKNLDTLTELLKTTFPAKHTIALLTTAQHSTALQQFVHSIESHRSEDPSYQFPHLYLPPSSILPSGEFLGCTCPTLHPASAPPLNSTSPTSSDSTSVDAIVCYADGRFHMDAAILANPTIPCYRFDPEQRTLTVETIDCNAFATLRRFVCLPSSHLLLLLLLFISPSLSYTHIHTLTHT